MLQFLIFVILLRFSACDSDFFSAIKELRSEIKGYVFYRGSPDYEFARPVHNGGCRNIFPLMIVKPLQTEDVAATVKFAVKKGLEISVRSGGHSYQCLGTKTDSIHIDLRPLNEVKLYKYDNVVKIGAGATWGNVLDVVDQKKYTFIHGNVSGYFCANN